MVKALLLLITIFEGVDGGTSVALVVVAVAVLLTADILPAASLA
jgi:hypothetical protein